MLFKMCCAELDGDYYHLICEKHVSIEGASLLPSGPWKIVKMQELRTMVWCAQMEEMMDLVQAGAVQAIDLRQKQEELRETDQNYIQVPNSQPVKQSFE